MRTADLDATVRFYTEVLGMIVADRPPIGFPGAWLQARAAGRRRDHPPLRGRRGARPRRLAARRAAGAIDHVSVVCQGYSEFRERFRSFGLEWRENLVPATPLWQLFVYDPNGVQLELTFHAAAESEAEPVIAPERRYEARERWFRPELYRQFAASR